MLKTYQFKTHCKGDSQSSETANIIFARTHDKTSLCAPKSYRKFKFFLKNEPLYAGWIVVVHLCCGFSLWRQMAPQESAKFITAFLVNFVPVSGRIASPIDLDAVFDICYGTSYTL